MADRRQFPDPDALLRHLDPVSIPQGWLGLSPYKRAVRGRYALVAMCAGIERDLAWVYAMKPEALGEVERDILPLSDERIEDMVRSVGGQATTLAGPALRRVH